MTGGQETALIFVGIVFAAMVAVVAILTRLELAKVRRVTLTTRSGHTVTIYGATQAQVQAHLTAVKEADRSSG